MKTKAMVLTQFNKPLELQEIEIPALRDGQVLVRLLASGVCGSDIHISLGEDPRIVLPLLPGHEGVGVVAEVCGNKTDLSGNLLNAGGRVIWNRGVSCGHCYYCAVLREPYLCPHRNVYGISPGDFAMPNGCFSEYVLLDARTDIITVQGEVDPAALVSASCSGATAAHAFDLIKLNPGDSVVIQGAGPIGMFCAWYAHLMGASQVILIGGSQSEAARAFGATQTLDRHNTDAKQRLDTVLQQTGGRGADVVIEAAGTQGAAEEGVRYVRRGGHYLSLGYSQPAGIEKLDFFADVVRKNLRISGVWVSDTRHLWHAYNAVMQKPALFARMADARYALEDANAALNDMASRKVLKAVLTP